MATLNLPLAPGDDLFRVAAGRYGDANGWTLIARANGLWDPFIQEDVVVLVPEYNLIRANGGVL